MGQVTKSGSQPATPGIRSGSSGHTPASPQVDPEAGTARGWTPRLAGYAESRTVTQGPGETILPRIEMVTSSSGSSLSDLRKALSAIRTRPVQQGTSM